MGNRLGKKAVSKEPKVTKRKRPHKNGVASESRADKVTSCPDLPSGKDEVDLNITLYRSYGSGTTSKYGTLRENTPDIKYYRKSTQSLSSKSLSLPRGFGRSRSTSAVPTGSAAYPELRDKRRLYDADDASDSEESRRTASIASSMSSLQGHRAPTVTSADFPPTDQLKHKLQHFHTNFVRSLSDKFRCLSPSDQFSNLCIALISKSGNELVPVTLGQYLAGESIPLEIGDAAQEGYVLTIPQALFQGIRHVRKDKLVNDDLWSSLAADVIICLATEAGNELTRMFEYQIGLINEDASIQRLAGHAASCAVAHGILNKSLFERNSVVWGAIWGVPVRSEVSPGLISIIIGSKELKWYVDEVLKKAALRKELFLFTSEVEPDEEHPPWQFYTADDCSPMTYGYRGLLLQWDYVNRVYKTSPQDDKHFSEEMSYRYDDFHRAYCPYARLVGLNVMMDYCRQAPALSGMPLAEFIHRKSGLSFSRDEIQPVYRPLGVPRPGTNFNLDKINLDRADLTRLRLAGARLTGTSLKDARLLLTDAAAVDLTQSSAAGANMSYSNIQGARIRPDTLRMINTKHVMIGAPRPDRRDQVDGAAVVMVTDARGQVAPVPTVIEEISQRASDERREAQARASLSPQHASPNLLVVRPKKPHKKRSKSAVQVGGEARRRQDNAHLDVSRASLPPVIVTQHPSPPAATRITTHHPSPPGATHGEEDIIGPQTTSSLQASPVRQRTQPKARSATNITHQSLIRPDRQALYRGSGGRGSVPVRMVKSVSHHGQLPNRQGRTQSLAASDVEFLRKSQVFLIMKGLQIANIESNLTRPEVPLLGRSRDMDAVIDLADTDRVVTLTGTWGVGKSSLCLSAAKQLQEKFICPVRINLRGAGSASAVQRRLIRHFGLRFTSAESKLFYNWLNCHEQRLLLLLDNLELAPDEDDKMSSLLDDVMFHVRNLRIICTSQRNFFRGQANHESYRVGGLEKHSEEILRHLLPDLHDEGVSQLAAACSHLPFALRLCGRVFALEEVDTGKLFEELTGVGDAGWLLKLEDEVLRHTPDEYEQQKMRCLLRVIATCLDNMSPNPRRLLAHLSCYPTFSSNNALHILSQTTLQQALTTLLQLELLEKLADDKYTMPLCVKLAAQAFVVDVGSQLTNYTKNGVSQMEQITASFHSSKAREALAEMSLNYDMLEDVVWRVVQREDAYDALACFASLDAAMFLQGELSEAVFVGMYESIEQQAEERADRVIQVRALSALTLYFTDRKDVRHASQAIQKAYEIVHDQSESIGETEQALALLCLGKLYWLDIDDRAQAQSFVKKALDIYKTCLGVKHLHTLFAFELYGWMLTQIGNFQSARHFYNISDFTAKELLGEHPFLVSGLDSRRAIWNHLSLFSRAAENAKMAVDIAQAFYGEHHVTGCMLASYCDAIMKRGSLADAACAAVGALAMRTMVLGDHTDTAASYKAMASLMLRSGQYQEAGRFAQNALDIYDRLNENERLKAEARNVISQARYKAEYMSAGFIKSDHNKRQSSKIGTQTVSNGVVSTDV